MLFIIITATILLGFALLNTDALANVFFDTLQAVWDGISVLKEKFSN